MTPQEALRKFRDDMLDFMKINLKLKVDKIEGQGLSTNDFTNVYKNKLDNITESADAVSYTSSIANGKKVGTININGQDNDVLVPENSVSYKSEVTNGEKIGSLNINGTNTDILVPGRTIKYESSVSGDSTKIGSIVVDDVYTDINMPKIKAEDIVSETGTLSDEVLPIVPVYKGGTGADSSAGAIKSLFGNIQNSISSVKDYVDLPFGITEGVYSGLKTNDPFTESGKKRVYAIRTYGSSTAVSVIFVTCLSGGNDTGRTFEGYVNTIDHNGEVKWRELISDAKNSGSKLLVIDSFDTSTGVLKTKTYGK